jgi:hypothetical protein
MMTGILIGAALASAVIGGLELRANRRPRVSFNARNYFNVCPGCTIRRRIESTTVFRLFPGSAK